MWSWQAVLLTKRWSVWWTVYGNNVSHGGYRVSSPCAIHSVERSVRSYHKSRGRTFGFQIGRSSLWMTWILQIGQFIERRGEKNELKSDCGVHKLERKKIKVESVFAEYIICLHINGSNERTLVHKAQAQREHVKLGIVQLNQIIWITSKCKRMQ